MQASETSQCGRSSLARSRLHAQEVPAYLDREVSDEDRDKFGHAHLASALRGLIEDEGHHPPYSIGLLGKWGTGKSTIKELYLHHLSNDETKNGGGVKRRDCVHTITFNAWKYGGESDIRKSLFRHIFLEIGGTHEEADRNLFKTVSSTDFQKNTFNEIWVEFLDKYALGLLVVGVLAALFLLLVAVLLWGFGFDDPITNSVSLAASAGIMALLSQKYFSNIPILSMRKPVHVISPPSQTIEEFETLFLAQLKKYKNGRVCSGKGKEVRRIVVFVDDLDRLTADEMVSGLDGIRSLIEMASHQMPGNTGIIFVISCDEERVADALSKRRGYAELPAAVSNVQDARRYLDRIFQFRLEIPPFPKRDMRNFVLSLLKAEYGALHADLQQRNIDEIELVDRMIHPGVQNPRNAIQIVNLFAQSWWLGALREHRAVGSENPGGLGESVITGHPITLAIVCVIRTDFPDFTQALQQRPRIFEHFIDRFIRPEPLEPLPADIREELAALASAMPEDGRWEIKAQHRGLRQFMSYVQDVRRPYSLQPFLALSQDPVSRKHGDKAVPIEEALRSSDVVALLDAIGLTGSVEQLSAEFGTLLGDLIDDLRSETPVIQDNVASTVAQIHQRIPEKDRRRVLGLVIRRAGASEVLRWRVGPTELISLMAYADGDELRELGRSLIADIAGDETRILLTSSERPSLREGRELAESAAKLVLEIMETVELPPISLQQFGGWLLDRTVKIAGQSDQLSVSWLERELSAHEDVLLPLIRDDYPRVILEEHGREQPERLNLEVVAKRLDAVFDHFFEQGAETRTRLWKYLSDFASLRHSPLVELSFSKFLLWHADADADAGHGVFAALGRRLVQNGQDADAWPLDNEELLRDKFCHVAEELKEVSEDGISQMILLAQSWSATTIRAASATRLHAVIAKVDPDQWATLNNQWAGRLFTDLPQPCQQATLTAAGQASAPNELRNSVASGIASLRGQMELNDHQIAAFSSLLRVIDESSLQASPIVDQLNRFIDDTVGLVNQNAHEVVVSKVRPLRGDLDKLQDGKIQELLNSFGQLQPDHLSDVYNEFREAWPEQTPEDETGFSAQSLFDAGINAMSSLGRTDPAIRLLKSLESLLHRTGLENENNQDRLVTVAYPLWSHEPSAVYELTGRFPTAKRTSKLLLDLVRQAVEKLAEGVGGADDLLRALAREVRFTSSEDIQSVTASLLAQPPQSEGSGMEDLAVKMWVDAVSQHEPQLVVEALVNESINDEQAVRLYNHALGSVERFSDVHFLTILQESISRADGVRVSYGIDSSGFVH